MMHRRLAITSLIVLLLAGVSSARQTPCEIKQKYDQAQATLARTKDLKPPAAPRPDRRAVQLQDLLNALQARDKVRPLDAVKRELQQVDAELSKLVLRSSSAGVARKLLSEIDSLNRDIAGLKATLSGLGKPDAIAQVNGGLAAEKSAEEELAKIESGLTIQLARTHLADPNYVFQTRELKGVAYRLATAMMAGDKAAAYAALDDMNKVRASDRAAVQRQVLAYSEASVLVKQFDPTGAICQTQSELETETAQLESKKALFKQLALKDTAFSPEDKAREAELEARREALKIEETAAVKLARIQAELNLCEAWDQYEAELRERTAAEVAHADVKDEFAALEKEQAYLVKQADENLQGLPNRIERKPNPDYLGKAIDKAKLDPELRKLAEAAKGDINDAEYRDRAKLLVYNEVRRLEREYLLRLADELSNYDCWPTAAAMIKRLLDAQRSELLAERTAAAGVDPRDLIDPKSIPDVYLFPWNQQFAAPKPAGKPVWVLQEPKIEAGANTTATASSVTVKNLPDAPQGPGSATITFTTPPATIMEGDTMTLTISASAAGKGWGMGWYNIGCARQWINKEAMAASWPEGNRTTKTYNTSTAVFTFGGSSKPYINLQAGQESGSSRWASITWVYKKQEPPAPKSP